jgi:hypothetical protein
MSAVKLKRDRRERYVTEPASPDWRAIVPINTRDHIVPLAAGGSDRLDNLQPAHRMCNVEKGDDLPTWWARKSKAERR